MQLFRIWNRLGTETESQRRQHAATYRFFQDWVAGKMGRVIIVLIQHPTPFYDDSYAVNSQNNGPYGDALWQELVPRVEREFRGLAEPWARMTYGGSTGGWESLAWQVFYPDRLNGTWTFCPDPVDFRYFQLVDIYKDDNAFYPNSEWKKTPVRPWSRGLDDQTQLSQFDASRYEAVLGTKGRSGDSSTRAKQAISRSSNSPAALGNSRATSAWTGAKPPGSGALNRSATSRSVSGSVRSISAMRLATFACTSGSSPPSTSAAFFGSR